ncbi:MAG: phosphotransferase [Gammaproteobacteria bacterium]|nr:phosphotransferase [Gammaproteobacteria bacterium]
MTFDFFKPICSRFDLGYLLETFSVCRGILHQVYPIKTQKDQFAIKILNPYLTQHVGYLEQIENAQKFARICQKNGMPAVTAQVYDQKIVFQQDHLYFMIFPWIQGKSFSKTSQSLSAFNQARQLLIKIHQIGASIKDIQMPHLLENIRNSINLNWSALIQKGKKHQCAWVGDVQKNRPLIEKVIVHFNDAYPELCKNQVLSHGDFLPKNVLWDGQNQPFIIDWEFAGFVNPECELFDVTFNWYQERALRQHFSPNVISGCLGNWLSWVVFNMHRTFWDDIGKSELKIAEQEISKTLECINVSYG